MPLPLLLFLLAGVIVAPGLLRKTTMEIGERTLAAWAAQDEEEPDEKVVEVSIVKLKAARYRRGRALPTWVRELDGRKIRLWGFMAIGTLEGVEQFELVPESCECGRSKVNHFVAVTLTDGITKFIPGRITLTGTFHVGEVIEDGFVTSVYRLTVARLPR